MSLDREMSAELAAELAAPNVKKMIDPRSVPVRFSRLKKLARSPAHYLEAVQHDDADSDARKLGRIVHALVLDQPLVVFRGGLFKGKEYKGVRNGAYWDWFRKDNAGKEIVTPSELEKAQPIAEAVRRHPIASDMLYAPGSQHELELQWIAPNGRRCLSHIDHFNGPRRVVADLKVLKDGNPEKLRRLAFWEYYHAQLAIYAMAVESRGEPTPATYLIVVENQRPYPVTVLELDQDALQAGRQQVHAWLELLAVHEASNSWPAYAQTIVTLGLPTDDRLTLVVEGEDLTL